MHQTGHSSLRSREQLRVKAKDLAVACQASLFPICHYFPGSLSCLLFPDAPSVLLTQPPSELSLVSRMRFLPGISIAPLHFLQIPVPTSAQLELFPDGPGAGSTTSYALPCLSLVPLLSSIFPGSPFTHVCIYVCVCIWIPVNMHFVGFFF